MRSYLKIKNPQTMLYLQKHNRKWRVDQQTEELQYFVFQWLVVATITWTSVVEKYEEEEDHP